MVEAIYDFDEKPLGSGASGDVYRVTHKETKEVYACKIVEKSRAINDSATMATEIEIMKRVRHRHIVSLVELFESQTCLWLVLELITGGDLMGLVANKEDYNEVHASRHMKQILEGLQYLHSRGVVHRLGLYCSLTWQSLTVKINNALVGTLSWRMCSSTEIMSTATSKSPILDCQLWFH